MRLLMLSYEFPPFGGGGGHALCCLLERFAQVPGLEVDVLTSAPVPGVIVEHPSSTVTVTRVGIHKRDLRRWRRAEALEWLARAGHHCRALVRKRSHQLVHAFSGFPSGWLCWRDRRARPYLVSLRGSDVPGRNPRFRLEYTLLAPLLLRPIWRQASARVACSEGLRRRALLFDPALEVEVIPNGVDLDRFRPAASGGGWTSGSPRPLELLTVGRLISTKRVHLLVEAVGRLVAASRPTHLTVVGGGELEGRLEAMVRSLHLAEAVTFRGWRPREEMPSLYAGAHLYLCASLQEGMSNAMLEAAAAGLPVVTTRCEGVDELVADNGIILEEGDAGRLAEAVAGLAADPARMGGMARAARARAERFSWDAAAERYLALYARVVQG